MFIYNLKLNSSKISKIIIAIIILIVLILCFLVGFKLYNASIDSGSECEIIQKEEFTNITVKNYTNILKMVHDDVDTYVGQKIKFSGFVYRVYDIDNNQFVLARNMIISSDLQTVIVGFLCNYDEALKFPDNTWVEIEGKIVKDQYHNSDIPVLQIINIKQIEKPADEYVYPPDDNYIPTSTII